MEKIWDVVIVGGGPAGLSAALYAGRAKLETLYLEKSREGGQITITEEVANYPGGLRGDSGTTLTQRMAEQAAYFGAHKEIDCIDSVDFSGEIKVLHGRKGDYHARSVILAPGASSRKIGCPGEKEFTGKGVSYCATCDAAFFEDLEVYVVGGGDAAVEEAMYLTRFARKVTLIHRRAELRAAKSICEKAFANPKLSFIWNSEITHLDGDGVLSRMTIRNLLTGEETTVEADEDDGLFGVFVFIGMEPQTAAFEGAVPMEKGYLRTDETMSTGVPGVFAAGDCRVKTLRQVVTAAADGAIAAVEAGRYVESLQK